MLHYFYHSCHVVNEIDFAEIKWKFPNYNMFCKMLIIMKHAFSPSPLIMLLIGLQLILLSYSFIVTSHQLKKKKKSQPFCRPCLLPPNPTTHHSPPLIFTLTIFSFWPAHSLHSFSFSFFHSFIWSSLFSFSPPVLPHHHHHHHFPPSFSGKITGKFL